MFILEIFTPQYPDEGDVRTKYFLTESGTLEETRENAKKFDSMELAIEEGTKLLRGAIDSRLVVGFAGVDEAEYS